MPSGIVLIVLIDLDVARWHIDTREAGDRRGSALRRAVSRRCGLLVDFESEARALARTLDNIQLSGGSAFGLERDGRVVEHFGQISAPSAKARAGRGRAGGSWRSAVVKATDTRSRR